MALSRDGKHSFKGKMFILEILSWQMTNVTSLCRRLCGRYTFARSAKIVLSSVTLLYIVEAHYNESSQYSENVPV
jgi:hypothetical protein